MLQPLANPTGAIDKAPISLAIMDRQQLTRDCLARLLSHALGFAVVGCCESLLALDKIVAQRRPNVALVAMPADDDLEPAVAALAARLQGTRLLVLIERVSPDLERRCRLAGAAGCISKEESLARLEFSLRQIAAGQPPLAGHDGAQLSDGELAPAPISFVAGGGGFDQVSLGQLTRREVDVLLHISQGYSVKQCAEALGISPSTAENHKSRLMRKLRVHKTVDLARLALRCGLSDGSFAAGVRPGEAG
jgi:DNA-binding NarL/FixJ family response regulator